MKRKNYISWDELFIGVAKLASKRSKDPDTQCGACIVDPKKNRIVSVGYNGLPRGLDDNGFDVRFEYNCEFIPNDGVTYDYWKKPDKYKFVVHAEENAILNASEDIEGFHLYLYTTKGYLPCSDTCAKSIIQKGIKEVILPVIIEQKTDLHGSAYTRHMFKKAGVRIRELGKRYL